MRFSIMFQTGGKPSTWFPPGLVELYFLSNSSFHKFNSWQAAGWVPVGSQAGWLAAGRLASWLLARRLASQLLAGVLLAGWLLLARWAGRLLAGWLPGWQAGCWLAALLACRLLAGYQGGCLAGRPPKMTPYQKTDARSKSQ